MTTTTSRRAILAGVAALPALATPALSASTTDPIFAAIERHRETDAEFDRRYEALDIAEGEARERFGHPPFRGVRWRKYSHIGRSEIDRARKEFLLHHVASPKRIEAEYRLAVQRYHDAARAEAQWYRDAGLRDQKSIRRPGPPSQVPGAQGSTADQTDHGGRCIGFRILHRRRHGNGRLRMASMRVANPRRFPRVDGGAVMSVVVTRH